MTILSLLWLLSSSISYQCSIYHERYFNAKHEAFFFPAVRGVHPPVPPPVPSAHPLLHVPAHPVRGAAELGGIAGCPVPDWSGKSIPSRLGWYVAPVWACTAPRVWLRSLSSTLLFINSVSFLWGQSSIVSLFLFFFFFLASWISFSSVYF